MSPPAPIFTTQLLYITIKKQSLAFMLEAEWAKASSPNMIRGGWLIADELGMTMNTV